MGYNLAPHARTPEAREDSPHQRRPSAGTHPPVHPHDGRPRQTDHVRHRQVPGAARPEEAEEAMTEHEEAVDRVAAALRSEFSVWIAGHPRAGLFDWDVAAENVLRALAEKKP